MDRNSVDFSVQNQTGGASGVKLDTAATTPKYAKLGENKGLRFKFRQNEVVHFPKPEDCVLIPKKYGEQDVLYIPAYSEARKRFVKIPLAVFRRVPCFDQEETEFFDPNERNLNVLLAEMDYDVNRAYELCRIGSIQCTKIWPAHRAWLEQDASGKWKRIDDKSKPLDLFELQVYTKSE